MVGHYQLAFEGAIACCWAPSAPLASCVTHLHVCTTIAAFRLFPGHKAPVDALPADIASELSPGARMVDYASMPGELRDELWSRFLQALEPLR